MQFAILLLALIASVSAFTFKSKLNVPCLNRSMRGQSLLFMADNENEEKVETKFEPEFQPEDPKLFDMNRITRLGRSRDQDGKSNIWSIEPKMVVEEEDEEGEDGEGKGPNKNLVIGGAVIGAFLVALPIFTLFSKLVPNPDDF